MSILSPDPTTIGNDATDAALGATVQGRNRADGDRRLAAPRPCDPLAREGTVSDFSQSVPLATMREVARYWATEYDFGRFAARLNALPQFLTEIDDSISTSSTSVRRTDALPMIITHGWPDRSSRC